MKKLVLLTTAAVMAIALSEPGLAASRTKHTTATGPAVQYLDAAGRARTYGPPTDAYASGGREQQYPERYSYPAQTVPYEHQDYGGTNGW